MVSAGECGSQVKSLTLIDGIQIRDVLVSGAIGRPAHINHSDCDVEMLDVRDMRDVTEGPYDDAAHYAVQVAKLSTICKCTILDQLHSADSLKLATLSPQGTLLGHSERLPGTVKAWSRLCRRSEKISRLSYSITVFMKTPVRAYGQLCSLWQSGMILLLVYSSGC